MDTQQHAAYQATLERMKEQVTNELREIGIHNPDVPEDWVAVPERADTEADENVVADRAEEWGERRATVATLETRYNNINRALKKIEEGTFGVCEISGEPIEAARLAAHPAARTCMAHMEQEAQLAP